MTARTCIDCSARVSERSTGRCRKCAPKINNAKPGTRRAISASMKRTFASDPSQRDAAASRVRKAAADWRSSEDGRARLPELTRAAQRARIEKMLGWCPEGRREQYRFLRTRKRMTAAAARAVIEAEMTPFERKLHAVSRGAGIVEKRAVPSRGYDFTLAGVSAGIVG